MMWPTATRFGDPVWKWRRSNNPDPVTNRSIT